MVLLYCLNAVPVAEIFGILLGYFYILVNIYIPFLTATPYLFLSVFPQRRHQSQVTAWGQGQALR